MQRFWENRSEIYMTMCIFLIARIISHDCMSLNPAQIGSRRPFFYTVPKNNSYKYCVLFKLFIIQCGRVRNISNPNQNDRQYPFWG